MTRTPRLGCRLALLALALAACTALAGCTAGMGTGGTSGGAQQAATSSETGVPPVDTLGRESTGTPVAPAVPTSINVPSVGIHASIKPIASQHTDNGQWMVSPPRDTPLQLDTAYWWDEQQYSAEPANPSHGTTFIYAHACQGLDCAFDTLHESIVGNKIVLATPNGTLTYSVTKPPLDLAKTADGIGASTEVYDYGISNRLVLITCGYQPNGRSTFNWAVIADLVSAEPA